MPPKFKFQEGEKVLCFHGPLIYEAKCLESEVKDKEVRYYIHYAGWNKSWDEWVPESRILKYNDQNVVKQKEVQNSQKTSTPKPKKTRKSDGTPPGESDSQESTSLPDVPKRTTQSSQENSSEARRKRGRPEGAPKMLKVNQPQAVTIQVPEDLKHILVEDWFLVQQQKQLNILPAKLSVDEIFEMFLEFQKLRYGPSPNRESKYIELTNGIREYFNVMLPTQLLYKFERPQHSQLLLTNDNKPMSEIYGFPHLIRLFVKLGEMMGYTWAMDKRSVNLLVGYLHEFLKYLSTEKESFYDKADYVVPPPDYYPTYTD